MAEGLPEEPVHRSGMWPARSRGEIEGIRKGVEPFWRTPASVRVAPERVGGGKAGERVSVGLRGWAACSSLRDEATKEQE